MSDTWNTDGMLVERWVSSTTPGYSFNVVIREGDIVAAGGDGDVVGPASVTADRPAVFDGTTGKLLKQGSATGAALASAADAAAARTALGLGTAATAATGDFTTPAQVDAQINEYHPPFNATTRAHVPVSNFGGTVGGGAATIAAFAGIPAGRTLWLQGQTNSADNGFYTALGAGEFELADVQPLGSATYVGREIVVGVDSEFGFAPTLWVVSSDGVTISATRSAVRPDQLTTILADYPTESELTTTLADYVTDSTFTTTIADYALDATVDTDRTKSNLADLVRAQAVALAGEITRVFRFDGSDDSKWNTPSLTAQLTTGIEVRAVVIPRRTATTPWFHEIFTQTHDGTGGWDNFEFAILDADTSFFLDGQPMVEGKPYLFWEQTLSGGSDESGDFVAEAVGLEWGNPIELMVDVDFSATRRRFWVRVPYELDDGATYHTSSVDGAVFRLVKSEVTAEAASIDAHTELWWVGFQFGGDIAKVTVRNGLDGTLVANPDASLVTPGATSFVDGDGNTWTGGSFAEVVSLSGGGTVDVVSNVTGPTILGKVTGTGDSEELTAAQVRSVAGVAPPPRLMVTGQYVASSSFTSVTSSVTNNRLHFVPVHIPRDITVTRIGVNQIATGSAGAGSVAKFGIYYNTNDLPAAAFDRPASTIDLETGTGMKYISGSWALTAGIWWIGVVAQVTSGAPTFGTAAPMIVVPSSDTTNSGIKFTNSVTGTLPDPASPGAANATSAPIIYLYV